MKLHLPKSLLAAVAYATVASSFAAEYDVGTITGQMNFPSNTANIKAYDGSEDGTDDGVFTLSGKDWLGAKDASGNKIASFGTLTYDFTGLGIPGLGSWTNPSNGVVSKNAKFGTLHVTGEAEIVLGGQYKSDLKGSVFTTMYAENTGIIANKVVVSEKASITAANAQVGSFIAQGGTVKIHTGAYQGNTGMRLQGAVDSKQVQIHNLLKVVGDANVTIGTTTKDGSAKDGHVATAFGSFTYTGDPSIEEGDESTNVDDYVTNVTDYNIHSSHIVQEGGTLNVYGKSLSIGGLNIDQEGGTMSISTGTNRLEEDGVVKSEVPMCHFLADYGDSTIIQNGKKGTTLSIGLLKAYNYAYGNVITSLKMNGKEVGDIDPKIDVTQSGAGIINLNGVYFFNQDDGHASTDVSSITQKDYVDEETGVVTAASGTINLNGNYEGATFDIDQSAADGEINLNGSMAVNELNQSAGTINVAQNANMSADSMSVGGTLTNNGTVQVAGQVAATGTMDNNKNLAVQSLVINSGTTTNAKGATLTAGSITVDGGTLINYGTISSASGTMMLAEGDDIAAIADSTSNLITIASGKMEQYGVTTNNILVKDGGTLTLGVVDGVPTNTSVGAVTLEDGANMIVEGNSKTGALTLEGGKITFVYGATLSSASATGIDKVEITVNLSDAALADIMAGNGFEYELFTNSTGTNLAGKTVNFVSTSGGTGTATVKQDSNGMVTVDQLVPEPTTATMSLLALAALAARRRRRK